MIIPKENYPKEYDKVLNATEKLLNILPQENLSFKEAEWALERALAIVQLDSEKLLRHSTYKID